MVPHLGHLTFLPAASGLAGRKTVSHSGKSAEIPPRDLASTRSEEMRFTEEYPTRSARLPPDAEQCRLTQDPDWPALFLPTHRQGGVAQRSGIADQQHGPAAGGAGRGRTRAQHGGRVGRSPRAG